jgi:hypothetical protein
MDTTAPALVADEAMTEDAELSALYDTLGETAEAEPVAEAPAEPEAAPEAEPEAEPAPTDLPAGVKAAWGNLPPEAREAVTHAHREMSRKLAEQTRFVNGLNPIRDVLAQAAQELPNLANMRPEQVAAEVMELARVSRDFATKPVETMLGLVRKHGMEQALRQALGGQDVTQEAHQTVALQNEISALKQQLHRVADPEYFRSQVTAVTAETRIIDEVNQFATTAEHWAAVEPHLPLVIPAVQAKLGESASAKDVLAAAYDAALTIYLPELKAQAKAAEEAAAPDPEKIQAALNAKSVNVRATSSGNTRILTEDEMLSAAYDRAHRK